MLAWLRGRVHGRHHAVADVDGHEKNSESLDPATPLPGCGAGCVGGIVLSLVWMVVLRYGTGVMAWLTIVAVNAAMISCTMLSYEKAGALH